MNAFITGTDTGVGKTYVTALLLRHARAAGHRIAGFKPICCGSREDAEIILEASGGESSGLSLDEVNPVWMRAPAAPYTASMIEGRMVDLDLIRGVFSALRARYESILVEGTGGWLVPISGNYTTADLAAEFNLPVIIVVLNRLGALNHTALTLHHLRSKGLSCAGLIFNNFYPAALTAEHDDAEAAVRATNPGICSEILGLPILEEIQPGGRELGSKFWD